MLLFTAPVAHSEPLFPDPVVFVGNQPAGIAAGDLDEDGHLDLVVANFRTEGASVLFGSGDGHFAGASTRPGASSTNLEAFIVDMNVDGLKDFAILARGRLSIYHGMGQRNFADPVLYETVPAGSSSTTAAIVDLNGDSIPDVVAGGLRLAVLTGADDGTLSPPVIVESSAGQGELFIVASDFDNDGCTDIVVDDPSPGLRIRLGDCAGSFDAGLLFGEAGYDAVGGDFNGDGHADVASLSDELYVHLGHGDGTFDPWVAYPLGLPTMGVAQRMTTVDLNGDGFDDIVASSWHIVSEHLGVLLSNGDGTFQPGVGYLVALTGGPVVGGDFNSDGKMDVVMASLHGGATGVQATEKSIPSGGASFAIFVPGDGAGGLIARSVATPVGERPASMVGADFDRNGSQDLAIANEESNDVSIALGLGGGAFVEAARIPVGDAPRSIAVGRVDAGDAWDLVVANHGSTDISILLGSGDGTFTPSASIDLVDPPVQVLIEDLDGNNAADVVFASTVADAVGVAFGNGDGTFGPIVSVAVGSSPVALVVVDLDGQHGPDLVVANLESSDVSVLLNTGMGGFAPEVRADLAGRFTSVNAIAAADFDGDGNQDVAIGGGGPDCLAVLAGDGLGNLGAPMGIEFVGGALTLKAADVNGDERPDLIASGNFLVRTAVVLATEAGFAAELNYAAPDVSAPVAIGDFDGDGLLDIAASSRGGFFRVLPNQLTERLVFESGSEIRWRHLVGYDRFNVYRGTLAELNGPSTSYGACRNDFDSDLTDRRHVDTEVPEEGQGFFYLMSRIRDDVETDLGTATGGAPRVPNAPCSVSER